MPRLGVRRDAQPRPDAAASAAGRRALPRQDGGQTNELPPGPALLEAGTRSLPDMATVRALLLLGWAASAGDLQLDIPKLLREVHGRGVQGLGRTILKGCIGSFF